MTLVVICVAIPQCMHLSGTIVEIWRLNHNGVTTLTFWSHVTSSVTWPFDSWGWTSYGWSIVTMCLFSTVMEIRPFGVLPGRLFLEQRSVVGQSVLNITLISYTPLRYVKNVVHEEYKLSLHWTAVGSYLPVSEHLIPVNLSKYQKPSLNNAHNNVSPWYTIYPTTNSGQLSIPLDK